MPEKYAGRLEITTRIGCSINCVFCPQKLLINRYVETSVQKPIVEMTLETFKKCIDKVPKTTRIDFSGMAEPWLNASCTQMVQYAYETGHPVAVYTTLVGMTEDDFEILRHIPMEEFVLHIPDDSSNSHIQVTEEYVRLLKKAINESKDGVPLVTGYSCHAGIHPDIISAIPEDGKMITEMIDRAGNLEESEFVESSAPTGELVCINCEAGINHNVLLPDGRVVLCCMDYGMKHVLGNLLEQSWEEIHQSDEAKRVVNGLRQDGADILCRSCTNAKNVYDIYAQMRLYQEWAQNLEKQQKENEKYLSDYKSWVENLQKKDKETSALIKKYEADEQSKEKYLQQANAEYQRITEEMKEQQKRLQELEAAYQELQQIKQSNMYKLFHKSDS